MLHTVKCNETTHALETRPLPRLRTPLLVRRWLSTGEVESGIAPCTDLTGVLNRCLVCVCVLACEYEADMLEILPDAFRSVELRPRFFSPKSDSSEDDGEIRHEARPTILMVSLLSDRRQ